MFPSRSRMEYMSEMNRLFPRNEIEDSVTPCSFNSYQSPFQSALVNRSSSSTDSTSPESYPDLSFRSPINPRFQDTPKARAIVGRKMFGSPQTSLMSPVERMEADYNFWQHEEPLSATPPELTQPKNCLYELFPKENKASDFQTPVKSDPKMFEISPTFPGMCCPDKSPISANSPSNRNFCNISPMSHQSYRSRTFSNHSVPSLLSPTWSNCTLGSSIPSQRLPGFSSNYSNLRNVPKYHSRASSSIDEIAPTKMCTFCRKNGETPVVYMTHCVKEQVGNLNVVTCPILRSHVCATCGATGDNAHTITYCPVLRSTNNGRPLQSTTITLKNTRIKSNGRRRY